MVRVSFEKGCEPESSALVEAVCGAEAPNLDTPGAPAFPRMQRVLGRKRLMRATSESDLNYADEGECQVSPCSRRMGFPREARWTIDSDSKSNGGGRAEPPLSRSAAASVLRVLPRPILRPILGTTRLRLHVILERGLKRGTSSSGRSA